MTVHPMMAAAHAGARLRSLYRRDPHAHAV